MSDSIESKGTTVEEAVSEALLQMGATKAEVEVKVIDEGKTGFLGLFGGRPAVVEVTRKSGGRSGGRGDQPRGRRGGRGNRRDTPRNAARKPEAQKTSQRSQSTAKTEQPGARAEKAPGRPKRAAATTESRDGNQARRQSPPQRRSEPAGGDDKILQEPTKATGIVEAFRDVEKENIPTTLEKMTETILGYGSFPCRIQVTQDDYHQVRVFTDDGSAGVLIGRHGSTIDAVEHLVERMGSQAVGERVRMNLDINNYRQRREGELSERVVELMAKVKDTGKDVHMEPLCARERRLVHLKVADDGKLRTYTLSSSGGKYVVIARENEGKTSLDPAPEQEIQDTDV